MISLQNIKNKLQDSILNFKQILTSKGVPVSDADTLDELIVKVSAISGGGSELITKNITENGTYTAASDEADGYSAVSVNVPSSATTATKTITANGTYNSSSDNVDGYSLVIVNVPTGGGGNTSCETGTITVPTDSGSITINHSLGVIPDIFMIAEKSATSTELRTKSATSSIVDNEFAINLANATNGATLTVKHSATENTVTLLAINGSAPFRAGSTYSYKIVSSGV